MKRISIIFATLALAVGLVAAQDCGEKPCGDKKEHCGGCKSHPASETAKALKDARALFAAAPKAEAELDAEDLAELTKAREYLMKETAAGRAIAPSYEACAKLFFAAAAQEGSSPEAKALLKEMGATYCSMAKAFGGCDADCCGEWCGGCCGTAKPAEGAGMCPLGGGDDPACVKKPKPDAALMAKKALEAQANAMNLIAAAKAEMAALSGEKGEKVGACVDTINVFCPRFAAIEEAMLALDNGFAALGELNVPAVTGEASTRDSLVRAAIKLHGECGSCESSCEAPAEAEEIEEIEVVPPVSGSS